MNYRKSFIIARKEIWEIWTTKLILWSTIGIAAVLGIGMPLMVITMEISENLYYYKLMMVTIVGAVNMMIGFILPIYVAADSFVGEKERRTLERLLAIPLTDQDLGMLNEVVAILKQFKGFSHFFILGSQCNFL